MRVRKRKGADQYILAHPEIVVSNPQELRGSWQQQFSSDQPLRIEVGSGKGHFITTMALNHPEINFIGIELQVSVLSHILDSALELNLPNLKLLNVDGSNLASIFAPNEVDLIYLNFSDPWPKHRHEKRRLTSPNFLKIFQEILKPMGKIKFKTDNRGLFEYSLVSFSQFGLTFEQLSLDLHHSELASDNVLTEYEEKFSAHGQPIYFLEARFNS